MGGRLQEHGTASPEDHPTQIKTQNLRAESHPYCSYNLEEEQSLVRALVNSMDFLRLLSYLFTEFKEASSEPSTSPEDSLQNRMLSSEELALQQILILFDLEFYFVF